MLDGDSRHALRCALADGNREADSMSATSASYSITIFNVILWSTDFLDFSEKRCTPIPFSGV